jgi:hypothetical protein
MAPVKAKLAEIKNGIGEEAGEAFVEVDALTDRVTVFFLKGREKPDVQNAAPKMPCKRSIIFRRNNIYEPQAEMDSGTGDGLILGGRIVPTMDRDHPCRANV